MQQGNILQANASKRRTAYQSLLYWAHKQPDKDNAEVPFPRVKMEIEDCSKGARRVMEAPCCEAWLEMTHIPQAKGRSAAVQPPGVSVQADQALFLKSTLQEQKAQTGLCASRHLQSDFSANLAPSLTGEAVSFFFLVLVRMILVRSSRT